MAFHLKSLFPDLTSAELKAFMRQHNATSWQSDCEEDNEPDFNKWYKENKPPPIKLDDAKKTAYRNQQECQKTESDHRKFQPNEFSAPGFPLYNYEGHHQFPAWPETLYQTNPNQNEPIISSNEIFPPNSTEMHYNVDTYAKVLPNKVEDLTISSDHATHRKKRNRKRLKQQSTFHLTTAANTNPKSQQDVVNHSGDALRTFSESVNNIEAHEVEVPELNNDDNSSESKNVADNKDTKLNEWTKLKHTGAKPKIRKEISFAQMNYFNILALQNSSDSDSEGVQENQDAQSPPTVRKKNRKHKKKLANNNSKKNQQPSAPSLSASHENNMKNCNKQRKKHNKTKAKENSKRTYSNCSMEPEAKYPHSECNPNISLPRLDFTAEEVVDALYKETLSYHRYLGMSLNTRERLGLKLYVRACVDEYLFREFEYDAASFF